jgi:hypothetical protein
VNVTVAKPAVRSPKLDAVIVIVVGGSAKVAWLRANVWRMRLMAYWTWMVLASDVSAWNSLSVW